MSDIDDVINACAMRLCKAGFDLLQADPHQWSERPCPTCRSITALIGSDFGCNLYAKQMAAHRKRKAMEDTHE